MGIVKKEIPVTEKITTKKSLYKISDFSFLFWFRFIYPYREEIERENIKYVLNILKKNFNTYLGSIFERITEEFLRGKKPFSFTEIGKFWKREKEIDLIALNEKTKEIALFEVKWKNLREKETRNLLDELKEKAKEVDWNNEERKEYYGVIAKKINGKEKLRRERYLCYDLEDMKN